MNTFLQEILAQPAFAIALSCFSFFLATQLYRRSKFFLFHPVLIAVALISTLLTVLDISYSQYMEGAKLIHYLLQPVVVALALPLYHQRQMIRKYGLKLLVSITCGSFTGIFSAVVAAILLGFDQTVQVSVAPKSVTTPIAMGIADKLGGNESITSVIVVCTGIFGAAIGPAFLKWIGIKSETAAGTALGTAAHGIGTARAAEEDEQQGAFAGLALGFAGIITAMLAPITVPWLLRAF